MNFFRFRMNRITLCFILFPFTLFAQTNSTETPDTSWFTDITTSVGLGKYNTNVGACIAVDVNNDDYPDLIFLNGLGSDTGWALYINEERPGSTDPTDRIFVDSTKNSGLNVPGVYKDLAGAGDFDNDGNVDIVVNCWYLDNETNCPTVPNPAKNRLRIFWGDGKGHFTLDSLSNTPNSGLESLGLLSGTGLPALDYDRDGYLDLFVACHFDNWCYQDATPAHLMHNNGNRTFTDVATATGINVSQKDPYNPPDNQNPPVPTSRALFGANIFDFNNDCWPDIFTAPYEAIGYPFYVYTGQTYYSNVDSQIDTRGYGNVYENINGKFKDTGVTVNWFPHFAWSVQGMVPWAAMPADYNNDGNMDFLAVIVHGTNYDTTYPYNKEGYLPGDGRSAIFTNLGPANGYRFKEDVGRINRSNPQNVTHGDHNGIWIDMNNDGHQDLILGDAAYDESSEGYPDYQRMFFELQDTLNHNFYDITAKLGLCDSVTDSIKHDIRRPSVMLPVDFDLDGDDDIIKMPYSPGGTTNDSITLFRNNIGNKNNHITIKLVAGPGVNSSCIGARITVKSGNLKQMKEIYGDQGSWTNEYPFIQNFGLGQRTMIDTIDIRWPDNDCTHSILTNVPANNFITINSDSSVATHIMPVGPNTPNNFTLYPNPDNGNNLNIKFEAPVNPFIEIYNELGQQVADYKPGYASSFLLPVGNLPAGLYFVHVIGVPGSSIVTEPFVKTNPQ